MFWFNIHNVNTSGNMKHEYFEYESLSPDIVKKEPLDEIITKKEPLDEFTTKTEPLGETTIKKEPLDEKITKKEPDDILEGLKELRIDIEFQKILSGVDLINTLLENACQDEKFRITDEKKYLSMLDEMEENINMTRKKLKEMHERRLKSIANLESLVNTLSNLKNFATNDQQKSYLTGIQYTYQNTVNYNCETKENIIKDNWKPMSYKPDTIRKFWFQLKADKKFLFKLSEDTKTTNLGIKSYDEAMDKIVNYIETSATNDFGKCICKSEDRDKLEMIWFRYKLCSEGAAYIKKYCGVHIGKVVLSEPHWINCDSCSKLDKKRKGQSKKVIDKEMKEASQDVMNSKISNQGKRKDTGINHVSITQRKRLKYERNQDNYYYENVPYPYYTSLYPYYTSWYGRLPYPYFR